MQKMKNKSLDNKKLNNEIMENLDLEKKVIDNNEDQELDSQTRDLIQRIRSEKTAVGIQNSFYVPEDKKEKNYVYQWSSTDRDSPNNPHIMERNGWKKVEKVEGLEVVIPTGGYTVDGQPGKHYLMKVKKEVHVELELIQRELAERQKKSISGIFKDGDLEMKVKQEK